MKRKEIPELRQETVNEFCKRVRKNQDTGCVEWIGNKTDHGYGRFPIDGTIYYAHRIALVVFGISVPPDKVINHLCSNKLCVAPSHLELTTVSGNTRYCRDYEGGLSSQKLSRQQVAEIKQQRKAGESRESLCDRYGIRDNSLSQILTGARWGDVLPELTTRARRRDGTGYIQPRGKKFVAYLRQEYIGSFNTWDDAQRAIEKKERGNK